MNGLALFMNEVKEMAEWDKCFIYNTQDIFDNTWKEMNYLTESGLISEFGWDYALQEHKDLDYQDLVQRVGYDKAFSGLKIYLNPIMLEAIKELAEETRGEAHDWFYEDMGEPDDIYN